MEQSERGVKIEGVILVKIKISKKVSEKELKKRIKKFKEDNKDLFDWAEYAHFLGEHPLVI